MAGKSIKDLAICQARVKHLLQPKVKSLSVCVCEIVNLTPNHQQIQITVKQLKSEEFSQNLTPKSNFQKSSPLM